MKYFFTLFLILNLNICINTITEKNTNKDNENVKSESDKEKDEQFKQLVYYYMEELGYSKMKALTREEFRILFLKIFENKDENKKESKEDLEMMYSLTNALFDYIVKEDLYKIETEKIFDFFDPNKIVDALKQLLREIGMEGLVDAFSENFMEALKGKGNESINKGDNNSDL